MAVGALGQPPGRRGAPGAAWQRPMAPRDHLSVKFNRY